MAWNRKALPELSKIHPETPIRTHAQTARLSAQDDTLV